MSSTGKGKGKKKGKTVDLSTFLNDDNKKPAPGYAPANTASSWADEMDNEHEDMCYSRTSGQKIFLPTAPKSARGPDVDIDKLPTQPPFKAFLANVPYDIEESDIEDFFSELKLKSVKLPREGGGESGRIKGFAYAEFEDQQSLLDALNLSNETIKNRPIRIDIAGAQENDRNRNDDRPDRTPDDWRSAAREDQRDSQDRGRNERESDYGRGNRDYGDRPRYNQSERSGYDQGSRSGYEQSSDRYGSRGGYDQGSDRSGSRGGYNQASDRYGSRGGYDQGSDRFGSRVGNGQGSYGGRGGSEQRNDRYGNRGYDQGDRYAGRGGYDQGGDRYGSRGGYDRNDRYDRDQRSRYRDSNSGYERRDGGRPDERRDGGRPDERRDGGRPDERRYNDGPNDQPQDDGTVSRPRLQLQKRTVPIETKSEQKTTSSIFGGAKPVDTSAKEREVEEKLKKGIEPESSDRMKYSDRRLDSKSPQEDQHSFDMNRRNRKDSDRSQDNVSCHSDDRSSSPKLESVKIVPAPPPATNAWAKKSNLVTDSKTDSNKSDNEPNAQETHTESERNDRRYNRNSDEFSQRRDYKPKDDDYQRRSSRPPHSENLSGGYKSAPPPRRNEDKPIRDDKVPKEPAKIEDNKPQDFTSANKFAHLTMEDNVESA